MSGLKHKPDNARRPDGRMVERTTKICSARPVSAIELRLAQGFVRLCFGACRSLKDPKGGGRYPYRSLYGSIILQVCAPPNGRLWRFGHPIVRWRDRGAGFLTIKQLDFSPPKTRKDGLLDPGVADFMGQRGAGRAIGGLHVGEPLCVFGSVQIGGVVRTGSAIRHFLQEPTRSASVVSIMVG